MNKETKMSWLLPLVLLPVLVVSSVNGMCPNVCVCNDESLHVDCVDGNLDIVPITLNPSIVRLNLRNNKIRSVDTGFSFYHQLTYVDLSHNHLVKVLPGSFKEQTKLMQLDLNSNKISQISNATFGPGLTSLTILNFRENLLESLEPRLFYHTTGLEELDLGQNSIKWLNGSSFEGLTNLRILKLDNNELTSVPEFLSKNYIAFQGNHVPHLAELQLNFNSIEKIGNDAFYGGKNIVTLDLRGNKISVIEPYAFRGLEVLRKLILTDNNLRALPTPAFGALPQLETLKIGRNPIEEIGSNAFQGLRMLKTLDLGGMPELLAVDREAFAVNQDLETIEITNGKKLALLPSRLFSQQSLKVLVLKDNSLYTLPQDLVAWRSLRVLNLDGNPFQCTCDLLWLRDLLSEDKFRNMSSFVLCNEPEEVKSKRLIAVSSQELKCYLNGPVEKTVVGVAVGVAVILLIIFFVIMYKYHDRIKNTCKRGFRRPARKNRSSVISSGKDRVDPTSKTSFLTPTTQYMYTDEEFAIRASLMAPSPAQSAASFLHTHSLNPHNHAHHLGNHHHGTPSHHNTFHHGTSLQRSHHPHTLHHPLHDSNTYEGPPHYNEYATPHVNLNYPKYPTIHSNGHNDVHSNGHMHYPGPPIKPIPITEL